MTYVVVGAFVLLLVVLCVVGNRRRRGGAGSHEGVWGAAHAEAQTHAGIRGTNNTGNPHAG